MAKLTREEVLHIASLIKVKIDESEVEWYQDQLGKVIDYLEVFDDLDLSDVEPTLQVTGLKNVFRNDEVGESLPKEKVFLNRNDRDGYFEVEKVI
jgi:aspartyl-tRNA(Asn)/glutamyl-tRNA(Gln) amidotransferase subunit C